MSWRRSLFSATLAALSATILVMATDKTVLAGAAGITPPLQLQALVREALERNPEIQAARRTVEAKRARIPQVRAWPDPMLSVGYVGNVLPPFTVMRGDPSSARQISASQEIPYPGKTKLRGEIAAREADAESNTVEAIQRRVAAEVKQAYLDLYFTDKSLATLDKDHALLEKLEKVAEIRYTVGKALQQDVLKAQVELSRLVERRTMLEQTRQTLEAQLNSLRDLPVDSPVGKPAEIAHTTPPYSLDDLTAAAQASFPVLKQQRALIDGNRLAVDLAKKDVRPNFSVGYSYMQRAGMPDMYGITFSTTLPIFRRSKQDMAVAEAASNLEAARRMEANELTLLRYRVKQEFLQVGAAEQLLTLYSKAIVPQSTLALDSSVASYEAGKVDFLDLLTNFTTVLDYELNYYQQLVNHEKALARLEELTGLDLLR
jgi:cobalt-zinc-cadmium efflux system outer membrane protein